MTVLRRSLVGGVFAFGVALAVVIGLRLEQAALTVIVGLTCGVGASIPTSLLVVALIHRRMQRQEATSGRAGHRSPPIVVVTPQALPPSASPGAWPEEHTPRISGQRKFTIIGDEDTTEF